MFLEGDRQTQKVVHRHCEWSFLTKSWFACAEHNKKNLCGDDDDEERALWNWLWWYNTTLLPMAMCLI